MGWISRDFAEISLQLWFNDGYRLEEIHQEKKRQIEKGSEEFAENLKKVRDLI